MWKSLDLFVTGFEFLLVFVGVFGVFYGKEDVAIVDADSNEIRCSGILYDLKHVVTIGHCFRTGVIGRAVVLAGDSYIGIRSTSAGQIADTRQIRDIDLILQNPLYDYMMPFLYDTCVLRLNESFVANCAIRTIPIWKGQRIDGLECIVAGWGRSQKASYELQLQRISMTIQSHDNCMKLAKTLEEQGSLLCAKDSASNGSLCYGDVGAALICEEEVAAISIYLVLSCGDNKTGTFFQEIGSSSEWFDAIVNWSGRGAMPKPKWKHFKQNEAIVKIKPFWLAPMVILVYLIPLR
ncbi:kallikrein-4-like isoform X2 [Hermetia illucens]|uniref:kallikrein-4-like isoform X2 n=1 Tax=Hermetia illucens TaxID=343691 RepID=UPI0018CC75E7|nr:kallikrein-4-like isoform X2 [Hermetia illucens]